MSDPVFIQHKVHSGSVVWTIAAYILGIRVRSVHYVGYADEGLIRALMRIRETKLSLMDYWDRYHRGAHFFNDDEADMSGLETPSWLDGIEMSHEGVPRSQALIWDMPWHHPDELAELLRRRQPPRHLILEGQAVLRELPANYDWMHFDSVAIGEQKPVN